MSVGGVSSAANANAEADAHARRDADLLLSHSKGRCEAALRAPRLVHGDRILLIAIVMLGPFLQPAECDLHLFQILSASVVRVAVASDDFRRPLSGITSTGN